MKSWSTRGIDPVNRVIRTVVFALAAMAGCVVVTTEPIRSPLQEELDANLAKWAASGLDTYEYRFVRACECRPEVSGPIIITVENGTVTAVKRPDDSPDLPPWEGGSTPTIPHLFGTVQSAIDGEPGSIIVEYDDQWGYPTNIYIDWDLGTADEETSYSASDLAVP